jgi:hypothetical protein
MSAQTGKRIGFAWWEVEPRPVLSVRYVLRLQQTLGNREVARMLCAGEDAPARLLMQPPVTQRTSAAKQLIAAWRRLLGRTNSAA